VLARISEQTPEWKYVYRAPSVDWNT